MNHFAKLGVLALCVLLGIAAKAQQQPAVDIFTEIAMAPLDRVDAAMKKAGFDGYRNLMTGLVDQFDFLGKGSLDTTRPMAMFFVTGEAINIQNAGMFMIPVKQGTAPLNALPGMQPLAGHADTVVAPNGFAFRRTPGYFLFGGSIPGVTKPTDDTLAATFKDESLLFQASVDLRVPRKLAPKAFEQFFDTIEAAPMGGGELAAELGRMGRKVATTYPRKHLDTARIQILAQGDEAILRFNVEPAKLAAPAVKYPRPAFPDSCVARVDYCYPARDATAALSEFMTPFADAAARGQNEKTKEAMRQMSEHYFKMITADAVSGALEHRDGAVVAYFVFQHAQPRDLKADLDELEKRIRATLETTGDLKPNAEFWKRSTYVDGDLTVNRFTSVDQAKDPIVVDCVQQGNRTFASFSNKDGKHLARVAGLKPAGEISKLLTAQADFPALAKFIEAVAPEEKETLTMVRDLFKDGKATLEAQSDGKALTIELKTPLRFLGHAMKLAPLN